MFTGNRLKEEVGFLRLKHYSLKEELSQITKEKNCAIDQATLLQIQLDNVNTIFEDLMSKNKTLDMENKNIRQEKDYLKGEIERLYENDMLKTAACHLDEAK